MCCCFIQSYFKSFSFIVRAKKKFLKSFLYKFSSGTKQPGHKCLIIFYHIQFVFANVCVCVCVCLYLCMFKGRESVKERWNMQDKFIVWYSGCCYLSVGARHADAILVQSIVSMWYLDIILFFMFVKLHVPYILYTPYIQIYNIIVITTIIII